MNHFQLAVKAHQTGQLQQARQYYLQHLSAAPKDPDALQLLGLVYSALGEWALAIENMQQSLLIRPAQPHVLNNLGLCYKKSGLFNEAKVNFEQASLQQQTYLDPYKNLIRLLLDIGSYEQAKAKLEQATALFPNDVSIAKLNAHYYQHTENYAMAISLYGALSKTHPNSAPIKHSLALNYRLAGQPKQALELFDQLEHAGMRQFQLFHNKANALSDLGQLKPAIEYYRKAINLNPAFVDSHINLNALIWETGDNTAFLKSYQQAFVQVPDNPELTFSYVSSLLRISQFQVAYEVLIESPTSFKDHHQYFDLTGQALRKLGRLEEAIAAQGQLLAFNDAPATALLSFAETLLQAQRYEDAEQLLEKVLGTDPENKHAWALIGLVWQVTGDARATALNDYDNLVREYLIEIPNGFESLEQFCGQLNEYLLNLHTANRQPLEQTLSGGTQTRGNLFQDPHPLITALVDKLTLCIRDYIEQTKPFAGNLPIIKTSDNFDFSGSWSVRLKADGFHTQHIHPMGWLSSAFYVQIPDSVEDDNTKQGWFKLGEPNIELATPLPAQKYIKPMVGKLILFQSYMWHGTVPFSAKDSVTENRMTVAFDVVAD